jgi:tetratricopeptide (TPR) repeat protein
VSRHAAPGSYNNNEGNGGVTNRKLPSESVFFIAPGGEKVSLKDTDRMFSILTKTMNMEELTESLQALALNCVSEGYFGAAYEYTEKILTLEDKPGEKARCLLQMRQILENSGHYRNALNTYARAFDLPHEANDVWYFLNNNLAYCLNCDGLHEKAEGYCRAAIAIDSERHNAHKNLGIALEGQGRYGDAARCFIQATVLCPADSRALSLLENLLTIHPEILKENAELESALHECREKVKFAKGNI